MNNLIFEKLSPGSQIFFISDEKYFYIIRSVYLLSIASHSCLGEKIEILKRSYLKRDLKRKVLQNTGRLLLRMTKKL